MPAFVDAHVVNRDDVRMLKNGGSGGLSPETLHEFLARQRYRPGSVSPRRCARDSFGAPCKRPPCRLAQSLPAVRTRQTIPAAMSPRSIAAAGGPAAVVGRFDWLDQAFRVGHVQRADPERTGRTGPWASLPAKAPRTPGNVWFLSHFTFPFSKNRAASLTEDTGACTTAKSHHRSRPMGAAKARTTE